MREHRILHPIQIARVIHMPHEINVGRRYAYAVKMRENSCHEAFIINVKRGRYSPIAAKP
jgi:hypothetical protein